MDDGFPFDTRGLWTALNPLLHSEKDRLFEDVDLAFPVLEEPSVRDDRSNDSLFELPPLNQDGEPLAAFQLAESSSASQDNFTTPALSAKQLDEELDHDIWNIEDVQQAPGSEPLFRTWETFGKQPMGSFVQECYVSEAGPAAFNAALSTKPNYLNGGVLPTNTTLRAFANLALGRSSLFFTWRETEQCFKATLPNVAYHGLSSALSTSLTQAIMNYAALFRRLQTFSESTGRGFGHCAVLAAFRGCVTSVLAALGADVSQSLAHVQSLLQLQQVIKRPAEILRLAEELRKAVEGAESDEEAVICLYSSVTRLSDTQTEYAEILTLVLGQASKPWLTSLVADMSVRPSTSSSQVGSGASLVDFNDSAGTDGSIPRTANELLTCDDQRLIKETRETAGLLRRHLVAAVGVVADLDEALSGVHKFVMHADPELDDWRSCDPEQWPFAAEPERAIDVSEFDSVVPLGQSQLLSSDKIITATREVLASDSNACTAPSNCVMVSSPFELIRPGVVRHSLTLNRHLLRYLFGTSQLRQHLQLQHDFHLLGNSNFIVRLSTALFAAETQTAGRKRGHVPTSEVIGLRIGARERQRWPPASSELRLTLMGVLTEAYNGETRDVNPHNGNKNDLPGGLSFAIRELSDADIDRVLEVDSIYALDFLRLQYAAPSPLDAILTPRLLQLYDDIFRHLLRLLRLQYATKQLHHRLLQEENCPAEALRFSFAALHVVGELMTYTMEIGIELPWRKLEQSLDAVERSLIEPCAASPGIAALRETHQQFLEEVRGRLFLRRKHEALLQALENVLTAILNVSKAVRSVLVDDCQAALPVEYGMFYQAVSQLTDLLQKQADRHVQSKAGTQTVEDVEMVQMLLMKLDWNEVFTKPTI